MASGSFVNLSGEPGICNDGNSQEAVDQAQQVQEDLAPIHRLKLRRENRAGSPQKLFAPGHAGRIV